MMPVYVKWESCNLLLECMGYEHEESSLVSANAQSLSTTNLQLDSLTLQRAKWYLDYLTAI